MQEVNALAYGWCAYSPHKVKVQADSQVKLPHGCLYTNHKAMIYPCTFVWDFCECSLSQFSGKPDICVGFHKVLRVDFVTDWFNCG